MKMTNFQRWILEWICRKIVRQGYWHRDNIIEYYRIVNQAALEEFSEESNITIQPHLDGWFKDSLKLLK